MLHFILFVVFLLQFGKIFILRNICNSQSTENKLKSQNYYFTLQAFPRVPVTAYSLPNHREREVERIQQGCPFIPVSTHLPLETN